MSPEPLAAPGSAFVLPPGALTASLRREVERVVADGVPPGKRAALVAVVDPSGVKLAVAAKLGAGWSLAADAERTWAGAVTGRVVVVGSW